MTAPTPTPTTNKITGPQPFTPSITDPVAFIIKEVALVIEKVETLIGPAAPLALAGLKYALQLIWVIAPLSAPLDGAWIVRIDMVKSAYEAGDANALIDIYNDTPLHPNEMRVLAQLALILLGISPSAFPA
jgi:hypothetical protein